ncbi:MULTISPECIES: thioredoxin family protein [Actinosynnema]|uniref:Thioredoxin n=1 Tax=Actinosynnema pretiosum TaxID=42197 RepID=A0A290ZEJ0_9PSEU|nr:thioredoxin family protein [Actinosynnema pretiosum]ATE57383.1 thiol reductase thioredoxin [Actinosynnema pretiosum]
MRELTDGTFGAGIAEGLHLVEFGARWCPPCRVVEPVLEELDRELPGLVVSRVDVDASPAVARDARIMSAPTLNLYRDGELVAQSIGARPKSRLVTWLEPHL